MTTKTPVTWLGRFPILDAEHLDDLETRAAVHEFRHRLPRARAEEAAHADYLKERALDAAAHHLVGVKMAHAAGHDEAAAAHGNAYAAAMEHAGHDPFQAPPPAVLDRAREARQKLYSFKGHPADTFFVPPEPGADPADAHIAGMLDKLKALKAKLGGE